MNVEVLDLREPDPDLVERVARMLQEGQVVAAPSDTVYGLLALPRSERARGKLADLKGRPGPFLVLVANWEQARSWTRGVGDAVWERLEKVWPGPVTAVLPTAADMPGSENGGIALRMPDSLFLTRLLEAVGEPLFSTSANPPGESAPTEASEVARLFLDRVPLVLDGGRAASSEPSTLVDLTGDAPRVIRPGRGDPRPLLDPTPPPP